MSRTRGNPCFEILEQRQLLAADPVSFNSTGDAYVRGGTTAGTNFGTQPTLDVKHNATAGNLRIGFLKFDLASLASTAIDHAILRIYAASSQAGSELIPLKLTGTSDGWDQLTVNFNNKPSNSGTILGSFKVAQAGQWFDVDLTAYVKSQLSGADTTVSLAISGTVATNAYARINSADATDHQPQLVIMPTEVPVNPTPPDTTPAIPAPEPGPIETIDATDDTYVRGGTSASLNFGSASTFDVKFDANATNRREGFVRFDLTTLVGRQIDGVRVRFYGISSQTVATLIPIIVTGADDAWDESAVTFNTRPLTDPAVLGTFKIGPAGQWFEVDITQYAKSRLDAGHTTLSLALKGTTTTAPFARISSIESGVNAPQLLVNPPFAPRAIAWTTKASVPQKREEAVSFTALGKLFVIGGYVDASYAAVTRVDCYDPVTNAWTRLNDAPTKITHAGVASDPVTGMVWMLGGYIGDFPNPPAAAETWKYDPANDTWTAGTPLPEARGAGGAGIVGRTLYFFSGGNSERTQDMASTWSLDLDDEFATWQAKADMPNPRNHFGTAVVGDKIYVIGGQHGLERASINNDDVHVYDPVTDTWTEITSMPQVFSHFHQSTAVYKNRYILTAGGEAPHDVARAEVYLFDTQTQVWHSLTGLPSARRAAAGGIIGDSYIVTSGYLNAIGFSTVTWSADLTAMLAP